MGWLFRGTDVGVLLGSQFSGDYNDGAAGSGFLYFRLANQPPNTHSVNNNERIYISDLQLRFRTVIYRRSLNQTPVI